MAKYDWIKKRKVSNFGVRWGVKETPGWRFECMLFKTCLWKILWKIKKSEKCLASIFLSSHLAQESMWASFDERLSYYNPMNVPDKVIDAVQTSRIQNPRMGNDYLQLVRYFEIVGSEKVRKAPGPVTKWLKFRVLQLSGLRSRVQILGTDILQSPAMLWQCPTYKKIEEDGHRC